MAFKEIVSIAAAVLVSVGGTGGLIVVLANWLANIWANRFIDRERARISRELETLKFEHRQMEDTINRKRSLYESLAKAMRTFVAGHSSQPELEQQKKAFLDSYDRCYLWASDKVLLKLGQFLDSMIAFKISSDPSMQPIIKKLFAECIILVRKDCGFENTAISEENYKFISF